SRAPTLVAGRTSTTSSASALSTDTTARPEPNSSTPVPNSPRPPAWPSCAIPLITAGTRAATFSASTPLPVRESIGNPSRPTTTTASTPARRLSASTTDRKSTRLNSSHGSISYAVFCLKKKKKQNDQQHANK